jgi:malonate transporter
VTAAVFHKLLAIFLTVALGWVAGRARWLEAGQEGADPARLLGNVAFSIFVPALLFRTTVRLDFAAMPWHTVAAFFVPAVGFLFGVYLWQRRHAGAHGAASPSVRAVAASFGNTVQVGLPLVAALFGEAGLAIHIALISLHAMILLSVLTVLAEIDIERQRLASGEAAPPVAGAAPDAAQHHRAPGGAAGAGRAGLERHRPGPDTGAGRDAGRAGIGRGARLPGADRPEPGLPGPEGPVARRHRHQRAQAAGAAGAGAGHRTRGLRPDRPALSVVVMMAALPVGSNALIFSQRYDTLQAETTAAIVISTVGFVATASFWLAVLAWIGRWG